MRNFKKQRTRIVSVLILIIVGFWCLGPLVWVGITSIKPQGTEYRMPVEYWPENPTLDNYRTVLGPRFRIQRSILNSLIVSFGALVIGLTIATMSAYAISRLRFKYRYHTLLFTQIGGMLPPIMVIAPIFVMLRAVGLLQTHWAMIIPNAVFDLPLATWLIAGYMANLPYELEEAAKLDGCGTLRTIISVIVPVAAPGMFSAGIIGFLGTWGEFMLAMTVSMGRPGLEVVPVTILSLSRMFELQWAWVAAGTILSLLPIIFLVVIFQRVIVTGLTAGSTTS